MEQLPILVEDLAMRDLSNAVCVATCKFTNDQFAAATPCTASRSPTNHSPTAATRNDNKVYGLQGLKGQSKKSEKSVDKNNK